MKTSIIRVCLILALINIYSTQAEILPQSFCSYCVSIFRFQGCLDKETFFCKMLALKFNLKPLRGRTEFCSEFPCEGYGQNTGTTCTGLLSCNINKILVKGICPLNKLCCAL